MNIAASVRGILAALDLAYNTNLFGALKHYRSLISAMEPWRYLMNITLLLSLCGKSLAFMFLVISLMFKIGFMMATINAII